MDRSTPIMHHDSVNPQGPHEDEDPLVASGPPEHLAICSLVLSSVGIHHTHDHQHDSLTVSPHYAEAAKYHLARYFAENDGWPERPPPVQKLQATGNPPTVMIIGCLVLFYMVTGPWQENNIWFETGAVNSVAIIDQGEWWRLVTALTLHADQVHLLGNCIIGGFIVHLLNRSIGYGLAFLLLIACGFFGNLLNIAARSEVHLSVGFSTSIFAAIGIFSGMLILSSRKHYLKSLLIPLGAGTGLLAMLGVSGERTDLGAHLFGFLCGIAAGVIVGTMDTRRLVMDGRKQFTCFLLTLGLLLVSWKLALHPADILVTR